MIRFQCDKCGVALGPNDSKRFIVKMEAFAAAGPIEHDGDDTAADHGEQIRRIIESLSEANPDEIEDQTYRMMRFDLCASCHRTFLDNPLG